jgi:hypothetical protein
VRACVLCLVLGKFSVLVNPVARIHKELENKFRDQIENLW